MQQIVPGLWVIDEIGDGVHCYAWAWEDGVVLIDTGFPKDATTILDALARNGFAQHMVKRIYVTHVDMDHTGGLAAIKRATRAPVACHTVEKAYLEEPARRKPSAFWLRPFLAVAGFLPGYHQEPVAPDELLVDGQSTPEGFVVVHTPGHTPGHISLLHPEKRVLIAGDALANRNNKLSGPASVFTPDEKNAMRSIWKLAKKYGDDFETVVFGHGPPILSNGGKRVKSLAAQIFSTEV